MDEVDKRFEIVLKFVKVSEILKLNGCACNIFKKLLDQIAKNWIFLANDLCVLNLKRKECQQESMIFLFM